MWRGEMEGGVGGKRGSREGGKTNFMVPRPDALPDPGTVMVEFEDTLYIWSAFIHFQV
jgi:hypothetical protein